MSRRLTEQAREELCSDYELAYEALDMHRVKYLDGIIAEVRLSGSLEDTLAKHGFTLND